MDALKPAGVLLTQLERRGGAGRGGGDRHGPRVAGPVRGGGWVVPTRGPVVSGFRTAQRPDHDGTDIAAPRGTTIRAAHAGTVVVATCNVVPIDWGCDRDGNPQIRGCGIWKVAANGWPPGLQEAAVGDDPKGRFYYARP
jgi:hypothetical protein